MAEQTTWHPNGLRWDQIDVKAVVLLELFWWLHQATGYVALALARLHPSESGVKSLSGLGVPPLQRWTGSTLVGDDPPRNRILTRSEVRPRGEPSVVSLLGPGRGQRLGDRLREPFWILQAHRVSRLRDDLPLDTHLSKVVL
jgi:hypothetical protein